VVTTALVADTGRQIKQTAIIGNTVIIIKNIFIHMSEVGVCLGKAN